MAEIPFPPSAGDLRLPGGYALRPEDLRFEFVRSGGPGGQNVNKVSTKVVLRFDLSRCTSLPPEIRARLARDLASRTTKDGEIRIAASEHRSQARNRSAALARLLRLLEQALRPRRARVATRPTRRSIDRRLRAKSIRAARKRERAGGAE